MPRISDTIKLMTPLEFELLVRNYVLNIGQPLNNLAVVHNIKMDRPDGDYQIDVAATFKALGCEFLVLIECKRTTEPIKREIVQLLFDKIRAIGAHKGIIFSTSGFQSGAKKFAKSHGIALVTVTLDGLYDYQYDYANLNQYAAIEPSPFFRENPDGQYITYYNLDRFMKKKRHPQRAAIIQIRSRFWYEDLWLGVAREDLHDWLFYGKALPGTSLLFQLINIFNKFLPISMRS